MSAEHIAEWKALHRNIAVSGCFKNLCSEPFLGFKPADYAGTPLKIAYVGKATAGDPKSDSIEHTYTYNSSAFWSFARDLREALRQSSGKSAQFSWSNVCKIAVSSGNPSEKLIRWQEELAIETLSEEMQLPGLGLVVLACEGFADRIVYEALQLKPADREGARDLTTREFNAGCYYSRPRIDRYPPILWVQHPQRKTLQQRLAWIKCAQDLVRND